MTTNFLHSAISAGLLVIIDINSLLHNCTQPIGIIDPNQEDTNTTLLSDAPRYPIADILKHLWLTSDTLKLCDCAQAYGAWKCINWDLQKGQFVGDKCLYIIGYGADKEQMAQNVIFNAGIDCVSLMSITVFDTATAECDIVASIRAGTVVYGTMLDVFLHLRERAVNIGSLLFNSNSFGISIKAEGDEGKGVSIMCERAQ